GVGPSLNPEPLAPFVDLIFIGEAEAILPDFLDLYLECEQGDREGLLARAAREIEGLYVPRFYRPVYDAGGRLMGIEPTIAGLPGRVKRRWAPSLEAPAASRIIASATEFGDRFLIELSRGCGRACRFCAAGHVLRPPRQVPHDRLLAAIKEGAGRLKRVGLISAAVSDTPGIEELCLAAVNEGAEVSVSSLRADTFTPALARLLAQGGAKTITFAPEAGSQRLREAINKGLNEADILQACLLAVEAGIVNLRLYFIIGLPGETEEDVLGVADLTKKVLHHLRTATAGQRRLRRLTLSVSSFVAKPQTPFQWAAMTPFKELKRRGKIIKEALKGQKSVRVTLDSPKWAHVEGLISRGDRRVGELLAEVETGGDWNKALARANLNPDFYTTRERDPDEIFPWEVVDSGISRDHLWAEYQFASRGQSSPGCFKGCERCGVCEGGFVPVQLQT
ncbi:MAG: radical SAM protein, partial [Deltaproteobacteria bacterium]|nr:radical SAM protein [Deltaproteobacteria bacterium]